MGTHGIHSNKLRERVSHLGCGATPLWRFLFSSILLSQFSFNSFSILFSILSILSLSSFSAFSTDRGLMVTKTRLSSTLLSSFFMQNLTPLSNSFRHSLSSHFLTFCTFCPIVLTHFITAFHPISCYCSNLFLLSVFCSLF